MYIETYIAIKAIRINTLRLLVNDFFFDPQFVGFPS